MGRWDALKGSTLIPKAGLLPLVPEAIILFFLFWLSCIFFSLDWVNQSPDILTCYIKSYNIAVKEYSTPQETHQSKNCTQKDTVGLNFRSVISIVEKKKRKKTEMSYSLSLCTTLNFVQFHFTSRDYIMFCKNGENQSNW